jgi:short-subunit dehydrogenase
MLGQAGATVVINARRADRLNKLRADLESGGHRVLAVPGDITSGEDRQRLVEYTIREYGRIDALINNAGYGQRGPIELVPLDLIRRNFETNLFSVIALSQLVIPIMRNQRRGRIVNISSVAGRIARPLSSVYDATKHALEAISDGMRGELAGFGIKVVIIEPGFIVTEFLEVANEGAKDFIERDNPYRKFFEGFGAAYKRIRSLAANPDVIAELVVKALTLENPKARYAAPGHAKLALALKRLLPSRLFETILNRQAGVSTKPQEP